MKQIKGSSFVRYPLNRFLKAALQKLRNPLAKKGDVLREYWQQCRYRRIEYDGQQKF
jgi:hypothetical protein